VLKELPFAGLSQIATARTPAETVRELDHQLDAVAKGLITAADEPSKRSGVRDSRVNEAIEKMAAVIRARSKNAGLSPATGSDDQLG
jgi:phosphosulfolactate synthase (CoM biosynthesis protein A)